MEQQISGSKLCFFFWLALPVVHLSKLFEKIRTREGLINKTGVGAALRAAPTLVFTSLFAAFCFNFGVTLGIGNSFGTK